MSVHFRLIAAAIPALCWLPALGFAEESKRESAAAEQVRSALRAELRGRAEERKTHLAAARTTAPDFAPARWHSGHVRFRSAWRTIEEVLGHFAKDKRLDAYFLQRATLGDSVAEQMILANWCRKHKLAEQERVHLMKVIQQAPRHADALRRLNVRWVKGGLLTPEEIVQQRRNKAQAAADYRQWAPKVRQWRDAIEGRDEEKRATALAELREVRDPAAIPALEKLLASESELLAQALIITLGHMPDQQATESLVRLAVQSKWYPARYDAARQLKGRPLHSYVPQLLSGMEMPIEATYAVQPGSVEISFFRETEGARYHVVRGKTINRFLTFSLSTVRRWRGPDGAQDRGVRYDRVEGVNIGASRAEQLRLARAAKDAKTKIDNENKRIHGMNAKLAWVLRHATGESHSTNPREWWAWWVDWNEAYRPPKTARRSYYHDYAAYTMRRFIVNAPMSCFPAGTLVWTQRGRTPVEQIHVGDRVLAQHADTGELKFQSVLQTTERPESPLVQIQLDKESISATRGHPFWVTGVGWRMAKHLKAGDLLHGVSGSMPIANVEEAKPQRAFNLVVDGFNTYFVGDEGLLVHDNVLRSPTPCVLPGLAESDVAAAEEAPPK